MTNSHLTVLALNSLGKLLQSRGRFIQGNSVVMCNEDKLSEVCQTLGVAHGTDTNSTFNNLVNKLQSDLPTVTKYLEIYQPSLLEESQEDV